MKAATFGFLAILFLVCPTGGYGAPPSAEVQLVEVRKIWDQAPHNAFTDLIRFQDRWFCVFREGQAHVSDDGRLRVITSDDGETWSSAALISSSDADLRDAKITLAPDGRLMLSGAAALNQPAPFKHQSLVWYSADGHNWSDAIKIGDPNFWVWRQTWHRGVVYGIGYSTAGESLIRLYRSTDGTHYETWVENLFDRGNPSETSLIFLPDETCLCLLRRDGEGEMGTAQLGTAQPPYKQWTWKDLGVRIGGPHMIRLPDGRIIAAGRRYGDATHTVLYQLDPDAGKLDRLLVLPSGGDTSYPGLVYYDGLLWVSYYSSHEGRTSIYLAKIKLPASR